MSKAILIMDMPSSCSECPIHSINVCGDICCRKRNGRNCIIDKPIWCPLRKCPTKQDENAQITESDYYRTQGYNACIDEILGGGE